MMVRSGKGGVMQTGKQWLRRRLPTLPADLRVAQLWNLFYLGFLFVNWNPGMSGPASWLPATLASIAIFLPVYLRACRETGPAVLVCALVIALLGLALMPINTSANTYLIYAGALLPFSAIGLPRSMLAIAAGLLALTIEIALLHWPLQYLIIVVGITGIVATAVCAANHFQRERNLRQAELELSHDEVRRLAALAERERIGRDLHDLLGHTLSLITLKSELAARLFDRDPLAARREIHDVERVAREALGQVRRAVTGIRTAGLAAELASARLLLESCGVRLDYAPADAALPVDVETALALTVREAVTNIQRHARATRARVEVAIASGEARLSIADDGRGSDIVPGNGLAGMRERLQALGGRLDIQSRRGEGTLLLAALPLLPADASRTLGIGVLS